MIDSEATPCPGGQTDQFDFQDIERQVRSIIDDEKNGRAREAGHPTIFHTLINSDMPDNEKTFSRLTYEGLTLIGAGTVTTAHVLTRTVFYVLSDPPVLERLRQELRGVFSDGPELSAKETLIQLDQLPYFGAVIKEGLRLAHAITHRNARVAPDRALRFQEWIIPPAAAVSMTAFLVHMDPAIYPEPDRFQPERWLDIPNSPGAKSLDKYLLPYNRGSRICLGMNLADAELKLTLAAIFHGYELTLFETTRDDVEVVHDFISGCARQDSKGVRVTIRPRK